MVNAEDNNRLQLTTGNRPGSLSGSEFDNRASHGLTLAVNPLQLLFILTDSLLCVTYRNKRNVCSPRHPPITNCGHLYPHPPLSPESLWIRNKMTVPSFVRSFIHMLLWLITATDNRLLRDNVQIVTPITFFWNTTFIIFGKRFPN